MSFLLSCRFRPKDSFSEKKANDLIDRASLEEMLAKVEAANKN